MQCADPLRTALGYYELGMADDALGELESLDAAAAAEVPALELRALVMQRLGRWRDAADTYARICALPRASVDMFIARGCCLYEVGDYGACRTALLEAPPEARDHGLWNYHLACYEALLDRWEEARPLIHRALILDPRLRAMARRNENMRKLIESNA